MKLRKLITLSALLTAINVNAQESIDYTWVEINYTNLESDTYGSVYTIALDGSYAINDSFYLSADYSQVNQNSGSLFEDSYGLSLGFHKSIVEKTDFYAELGYRWYDLHNNGGIVSTIGTRTLLSEKFELITALEYKDYNTSGRDDFIDRLNAADEGLNLGLTALYKFNNNSSVHFGVKEKASNISPTIGYRYSW